LLLAAQCRWLPDYVRREFEAFLKCGIWKTVSCVFDAYLFLCRKPTPGLALYVLHNQIRIIGASLVLSPHHLLLN
jgi:hypothetical protein